jgi:hypothetical protein
MAADVAHGEDLVDFKLMDRIGHPQISFIKRRPRRLSIV